MTLDWVAASGWVSLSVEDNGQGFDWEAVLSRLQLAGIGLRGMQERFESLGGGVLIESHPGAGTRIVGYLPIAAK